MSEVDDLGLDEILDDETETEEELNARFYSEDAATGEIFDPNADAPESVQNGTCDDEPVAADVTDVPVPEVVGEVTQARIDPNNPPERPMTPMEKRQARREQVREQQLAADKAHKKAVAEANARKVLDGEDEKPEQE